jgi:hypothetical protein
MKKNFFKGVIASVTLTLSAFVNAEIITLGDVLDDGNGTYDLSTNGADTLAVDNFFGLIDGTVSLLGLTPGGTLSIEGSGLKDTTSITIGQEFTFDWLWSSDETSNQITFNDFAFVVINTADTTILADTFIADGTGGTFSWEADYTGAFSYGIAIMDVGDEIVDSSLEVSNINITAVPEPTSIALFALSLLGFTVRNFKKKD